MKFFLGLLIVTVGLLTLFVQFEKTPSNESCIVGLEGEADQNMLEALNGIECDEPTIRITSEGGEGDISLSIAEVIKSKKATIIIDNYCFSACSEFFLAAADKVVFENKPLIGFHGNPAMKEFFANHYDIPDLPICEFDDATKMQALYDHAGLNIDFWRKQLKVLRLKQFTVQSDAPIGKCPSMWFKFQHELWFPSSKELKDDLSLKFKGDVCADDRSCDQKVKSIFPKGTFVVGNRIVHAGTNGSVKSKSN